MIRCAICEEYIAENEEDELFRRWAEWGQLAEMFNPNNEEQSGIVHTECGVGAGWELS